MGDILLPQIQCQNNTFICICKLFDTSKPDQNVNNNVREVAKENIPKSFNKTQISITKN